MKTFLRGVIIILITIAASIIFLSIMQRKVLKCSACERVVSESMAYHISPVFGKAKTFCCPRCALRYEEVAGLKIRCATATDYFTKESLDASEAFYVEGSEEMVCCKPTPMRTEGGCFYKTWDRCSPSLVAFKTKAEAEKFQSQFGGKIVSYQELHK